MRTKIIRFVIVTAVIVAGANFSVSESHAQATLGENWFDGVSHQPVETVYQEGARGPLARLLAPGTARTITVLGGFNFLSDGVTDDFDDSALDLPSALLVTPSGGIDQDGYAISFAFGRRRSERFRTEVEVAFRSNDINESIPSDDGLVASAAIATAIDDDDIFDDLLIGEEITGRVDVSSLMKNFIFDFQNNTRFTPYAGAGIGISYIDVEIGEDIDGEALFQDSDGVFSYQAIGGVATKLTAAADFLVEYRFLGTADIDLEGLDRSITYNTSTLFLGVKLEF